MARLQGKVAPVTGAARGQGRAHAVTLAREGADVVAVDIDRQIDTPMTNWPGIYDKMAGRPGGDRTDYEASARHFGVVAGQGALPPEVVAHAAAYLVSEEAAAITGQTVVVDSGHLALAGYNPAPA